MVRNNAFGGIAVLRSHVPVGRLIPKKGEVAVVVAVQPTPSKLPFAVIGVELEAIPDTVRPAAAEPASRQEMVRDLRA